MATVRPADRFDPPPPLLRADLDACILSSVLFYSAINSIHPFNLYLLSSLSAIVLLLNSLYLHTPFHLPSLTLALISAFLPFYHSHADAFLTQVVRALPDAPILIVEAALGAALIGNFVRLAIFRPLANARKERRHTGPIPAQHAVPSELVRQEWRDAATAQAAEEAHRNESACGTAPDLGQPSSSAEGSSQAAAVSVADARQAAQVALEHSAPSSVTADATREASSEAKQAASSRAAAKPSAPRRRKRLTQSQILAAKIMRQRDSEAAARRAKLERTQEAARLAAESAKAAKEQRQRERERLQENVRGAAKGVTEAKETLKQKSLEADRARQERRRAADQLKLSPGEENEKALDGSCKEAARMEMEEQRALDDVNAAQARLIDLRDQLNRFSMR